MSNFDDIFDNMFDDLGEAFEKGAYEAAKESRTTNRIAMAVDAGLVGLGCALAKKRNHGGWYVLSIFGGGSFLGCLASEKKLTNQIKEYEHKHGIYR